jgi:leucine-zipper of insertion element IS481
VEEWWLPAIGAQTGARRDIHKNARTTPHGRLPMVRRVLEQRQPAIEVGADLGGSERTVRRWLARVRRTHTALAGQPPISRSQ